MNRIRRWWLRNFVYGPSLYDFAVLSVRAAEAAERRQKRRSSPGPDGGGDRG